MEIAHAWALALQASGVMSRSAQSPGTQRRRPLRLNRLILRDVSRDMFQHRPVPRRRAENCNGGQGKAAMTTDQGERWTREQRSEALRCGGWPVVCYFPGVSSEQRPRLPQAMQSRASMRGRATGILGVCPSLSSSFGRRRNGPREGMDPTAEEMRLPQHTRHHHSRDTTYAPHYVYAR